MKLRKLVGDPIKIKRPKNISDSQWNRARELYVAAKNVGDKFPEVTVAQAALETGWFKKESGKNNIFGQKASSSQKGSAVVTHEIVNGKKVKITDKFRDYESLEESLLDRKEKWMSKYENAETPDEAVDSIWRYDSSKNRGVGYATDSNYGGKISTILGMMGVESGQRSSMSKNNPASRLKEQKETVIDNLTVRKPRVPLLATRPINPDYAPLPENNNQVSEQKGIDENQIRQLLEKERSAVESRFLNAFQQQSSQESPDYSPQVQQEDLSHLYNYINVETYADGGKYTVKKGDTLSKIAKNNNLTLNEVLDLNKSYKNNPNLLNLGDEIVLSKPEEVKERTSILRNVRNFSGRVQTRDNIQSIPLRKMGPVDFERISNANFNEVDYEDILRGPKEEKKTTEKLNRNQILELQETLVNSGYDIGKTGRNKNGVDGVLGPKTINARKDYEGISERFIPLENDTDIIEYQKRLQSQGQFKGIEISQPKDIYLNNKGEDAFMINSSSKCGTKFCTAYVGKQIEKEIGSGEDSNDERGGRKSLDAYGDAWTYNERIVNNGGQEIYSVFDNKKPQIEGGNEEIENYIQGKVDGTDKLNYNDVRPGDTLNLFYPGSSFAEQAYKEGSKYFTSHAGIVKKDKKNNLFVEHNVGGRVYKSPLQDFIDGEVKNSKGKTMAITAVVRPNYEDLKNGSETLVNKDKVTNEDSSLYNYNHSAFSKTLESNSKELKNDLNITDSEFSSLSKAMRSIAFKESDYGDSNSIYHGTRRLAGSLKEAFGFGEKSRGMTSLKDEKNLPENLRNMYIKDQGENLDNPIDSAVPSFYALGARYKYLKDLNTVDQLNMSQEDIIKLSMLAWNEDVSVVAKSMKKYKTYDDVMNAYRGDDNEHAYDLAFTAYEDYLK